ncbi:hypothetical protein BKA66DRAFT_558755 [Pyrenochaeta sp. MPI-SDFR-AT-0127]|nr:hypothetical protein BKA66DRAFT_558755 [Pyrenochaeta sp. MPI-SDFR-AT-0127]
MFQKAVAPITERLSKQLGHMPEYTTLFIPSIFDYNVRDAAASAVFGDYFDRAVRPGWTREATCPGFGFLEGKNLGRKPEECVDGGPVNVILVFEYENDYLYAWLMEVEFELQTYPVILKEICKECGESFQEEIDEEAYKKRVNTFLHNFINDQVMRTHQRDSLRAIIISGEATTPAITSLGVMAKQAVGTETVKIMTDIDPPEVVAHGAAVWARLTQQIPQVFMPDAGNGISPLGHDEL